MDRYTNLQPATDHVDGARSFSIMTSRGCPYRCTFCSQSIMPIKWRSRSPENVLAEWRHLVEDLGARRSACSTTAPTSASSGWKSWPTC
jgi:anaerobic magnesium-protoporphyrin IX monomethyl ester cyclase